MSEKLQKVIVCRCSFSNGHQTSSRSSFVPGWLVLLLQLKTQHSQNSVHGILFLQQLHLPSHSHLHSHLIRCITASGASGFEHWTGEKWLELASKVQSNAACAQLCWEVCVIFTSFPPNHDYVVCMPNMYIQWTRSWWKVFCFSYTIWVEKPAELFYYCVDFWSVQHTNKTFQLRAYITFPSIASASGISSQNLNARKSTSHVGASHSMKPQLCRSALLS